MASRQGWGSERDTPLVLARNLTGICPIAAGEVAAVKRVPPCVYRDAVKVSDTSCMPAVCILLLSG